jgi:hypothetical protein
MQIEGGANMLKRLSLPFSVFIRGSTLSYRSLVAGIFAAVALSSRPFNELQHNSEGSPKRNYDMVLGK